MRLCIIAGCVSDLDARTMLGAVTYRVDDLTTGLGEIRAERCDCIVTPKPSARLRRCPALTWPAWPGATASAASS